MNKMLEILQWRFLVFLVCRNSDLVQIFKALLDVSDAVRIPKIFWVSLVIISNSWEWVSFGMPLEILAGFENSLASSASLINIIFLISVETLKWFDNGNEWVPSETVFDLTCDSQLVVWNGLLNLVNNSSYHFSLGLWFSPNIFIFSISKYPTPLL